MALGFADHVWSLGEVIGATLAQVPADLGCRDKNRNLPYLTGD
jgi:hypothetical protein